MPGSERERDAEKLAHELLVAGAEAELQLLKRERKAERRLAEVLEILSQDRARFSRAQRRVEKSMAAVADAEAALRECQLRRAVGPSGPED
jgi:hypothetical protein